MLAVLVGLLAGVLAGMLGVGEVPERLLPSARGGAIVLGVGPHLKNTVALSVGENVFVSQHIGDLETAEAFSFLEVTTATRQK